MNKIAAVVTTYNRLELLKENIIALLSQTYQNVDVIIVNNNSSDGTEKYVKNLQDKRIKYFNTGANLGGAGGFSFGIEKAARMGYQFVWLMDDDTIPKIDSLEKLMDAVSVLDGKFSFLASTVYWTDGSVFPMNTPHPSHDSKYMIEKTIDYNLLKIDRCSFVGCFVNMAYVRKAGLPISEYFIYGDDVEYTMRLSEQKEAYWVLDSFLIHKAPGKIGSDVVNAPYDRIDRFYKQSRNGVHLHRMHGGLIHYYCILAKRIFQIIKSSPDYKIKRIDAVVRGAVSGLFFNPPIRFVDEDEK